MAKSKELYSNYKVEAVSVLDTNSILCYDSCIFENENAVMKRVHFWKFYRESLAAEKGEWKEMEDGFGAVC